MTSQSPSDRVNRASNEILEATSFLSSANAAFIEGLYARWLENPDAVDPSWRAYFAGLGEQARAYEDAVGARAQFDGDVDHDGFTNQNGLTTGRYQLLR